MIIKINQVVKELNTTKEKVIKMSKYCDRNVISNLCCECKYWEPCQQINKKLYKQTKLNGKLIGAFFMSNLLVEQNK